MYQPQLIINLRAIKNNFLAIKKYVGPNVITSAVVKANAYGLGAQIIANTLYDAGCRHFWVAYLSEALNLRQVLSDDCKIYILQGFNSDEIGILKQHKLTSVINSIDEFNKAYGNDLELVLFIETGLGRLGIRENEIDIILQKLQTENISCVISHLACASDKQNPYNHKQLENFNKILSKIRKILPVKASIAASNGIFLGSNYHCDMVRVGGFLYGQYVDQNAIQSECAVRLSATVLQKYTIHQNESVGYSRTFICQCANTKVAILSIGYADGISRSLSNKWAVWFANNNIRYKAPIIGNISMDLLACDVTNVPDDLSIPGSSAILLDDNYTASCMAADIGTTTSNVLTSINFSRFKVNYID